MRRFCCTDRQDELLKVTTMIKELLANGENPSDIAVLYRTNQQAELVADMMMSMKIPFVSTEKNTKPVSAYLLLILRCSEKREIKRQCERDFHNLKETQKSEREEIEKIRDQRATRSREEREREQAWNFFEKRLRIIG